MKIFLGIFLLMIQVQAANIFPLTPPIQASIYCQWYVPVTSRTEDRCQSSCFNDCEIIYGTNYTGYNACVEQEFGYDCYCAVCY